jgi:hypothetical protein
LGAQHDDTAGHGGQQDSSQFSVVQHVPLVGFLRTENQELRTPS